MISPSLWLQTACCGGILAVIDKAVSGFELSRRLWKISEASRSESKLKFASRIKMAFVLLKLCRVQSTVWQALQTRHATRALSFCIRHEWGMNGA